MGFSQSGAFNSLVHTCQGLKARSKDRPLGLMQKPTQRKRNQTHTFQIIQAFLLRHLLVKSLWENSNKWFSCCLAILITEWMVRLKKFCYVFIHVKRRRVWGSRRKASIVCGVWTWRTGHLGSAQSNTACTLPSNLFGLSDPLSLPLGLTTHISAPSCQHSLFSVKRK